MWAAATGELLQRFAGSQGEVTGVAFSPDGARLAVISSDGVVRVCLLRLDDLLALARTRATRTLSDNECRQFLRLDACP